MEPDGTHSARLTLEGVNFNAMIGWLANLQSQGGIRVERASIEPLAAPGTVNAKITLRKAGA
jgi:type II secretory pathway component PulM